MNTKKPLVSIIVPAYNHEDYISECIESILKQDYENIELIIIDDGSKDNTYEVICNYEQEIEEKLKNHIIIKKNNEGVSKTINLGIEKSTGEYICIIASDDVMMKDRIKIQIEYMVKSHSRVSCGNSYIIRNDRLTDELVITDVLKYKYYKGNQFYNLIENYFISTPTAMIRRDIINEFGTFNPNFPIEDWPYYVDIASKYNIDYIDEVLCAYRLHSSNSQTNKKKMFIYEKEILNSIFEKHDIPIKVKRKAISQLYIRNVDRRKYKVEKLMDLVLSQIIYFNTEKWLRKIKSIRRIYG
ncbi:glycosyltransferase family 2 protein [Clostridium tertium]|uniref:glycosyltransferase family 2 protein n=1 Tax=Clostridium tertium TaxID=1559 RepID=UPI00232AFC9C|nr:glycosyltransferase family 2 protein [Clostridium tertium]MDB1921705.1 glycosyltransferase family 2 protein [Clostridium tertium]MDB1924908.1 glycosyltransferase family 2 protein [Clostridium tertium]MDB1929547.1 glycosyltransferase family 2 protein [Clostridium tertium]